MSQQGRILLFAASCITMLVSTSIHLGGQTKSDSEARSMAPYLGIAEVRDAKPGVLIAEMQPNSPAERAGLATGDIIQEFGEHAFRERKDPRIAFYELVQVSPVNKAIRVVFTRGGEQHVTYVRLVAQPRFGLLTTGGEDRKIVRVIEGSPAAVAGIRPGDILVEYGKNRPGKNGDIIPVTLERDGQKVVKECFFPRQGAAPGVSSAQDYVLTKFGEPESFSVSFVAQREGSDKTVRGETWNYHTLGKSFLFADGVLVGSEPIDILDDNAVFSARRPWDFDEETTIEDVFTLMPKKTFVRMELATELIEDGVMYCTEQLSLGFKDDALVFVESIPLVPAEEDVK